MTVTSLCLIESKDAANANITQYTAAAAGTRTVIDKFTATNYSGGAQSININLVPFGQSATNSNLIKTKLLASGECYTFPEIVGHTLNPGDYISTIATAAASINIRASGRENT
jgi:hypothetical protein